jgi:hypothetical protein
MNYLPAFSTNVNPFVARAIEIAIEHTDADAQALAELLAPHEPMLSAFNCLCAARAALPHAKEFLRREAERKAAELAAMNLAKAETSSLAA